TLRVNQNQQGVYLQVINTGVEIPESEQAKVFERFYRLPQHDRWKHGGTGLGLPLVKELTERMGGTITLQSRNNQVCFTVQFSDSRFASTDQQNAYLPGRG
ncbi:MAG: sensor histidine kinase, partial [Gloeomargarita sp. SKYG98]|nr:sensor histidine kinase [Gloeomargarita sp. SKYG98]